MDEATSSSRPEALRLPSLFSNDFGSSALLYPTPTRTTRMNYGEAAPFPISFSGAEDQHHAPNNRGSSR